MKILCLFSLLLLTGCYRIYIQPVAYIPTAPLAPTPQQGIVFGFQDQPKWPGSWITPDTYFSAPILTCLNTGSCGTIESHGNDKVQ